MLDQEALSLFEAVKKENLDKVRSILANKSHSDRETLVMQKNEVAWTPLFYAMGCEQISDYGKTKATQTVNIDIINLLIGISGIIGTKEFLLESSARYGSNTKASYNSATGLISVYGLFSDTGRDFVADISYDIDPTGQIINYIEKPTDKATFKCGFLPTF